MNIRGSFAQTHHCDLHIMDLRRSHRLFVCVEVPNKNGRVVVLGDVSAVGTRSQATVNINDVLYIERKRLIEWRVEVTVWQTCSTLREEQF